MNLYRKLIHDWEHKLHDTERNGQPSRVRRPFEWGGEWLGGQVGQPAPVMDPARSDEWFSYHTPSDYRLQGNLLTFSTALPSPYPENNTVHARWFPAKKPGKRAVIVIPQWNADVNAHVGLCRLLNAFGLSALRMSMPYHDYRMPAELTRADYAVSANVGRTVHANRQAVIDARCLVDWLMDQGYQRIGMLGTSLGSCIAFITTAHEPRITAQACNHCSTYFADVVWRGLSTSHIAEGLRDGITLEELRRYWAVISPASYMERFAGRMVETLFVWARYDLSFPPDLSREVVAQYAASGQPCRQLVLPCGHYTTGVSPFKWLDGWGMARFLAKTL
jgi:hypothetical protein